MGSLEPSPFLAHAATERRAAAGDGEARKFRAHRPADHPRTA